MIFPCIVVGLFEFVFLTRLVMTFFPIRPTSLAGKYRDLSITVTDPVLNPVRKMMPPVGGFLRNFGLAEIVVLLGVSLLGQILCSLAI